MSEKQSIAIGAQLTPETFSDFVERLLYHTQGEGVHDHCTADAIFLVQAKKIVSGIDENYTDQLMVYCDDCQWYSPKEYWDDLDAGGKRLLNKKVKHEHETTFLKLPKYEQWEVLRSLPDHSVTGWDYRWDFVSAHFTKEAAEAYIARKKHDYRDGLRVFVEAQVYCWEFNTIKKALLDGNLVMKAEAAA